MRTRLLSVLAASLLAVLPVHADQILGPSRIDSAGKVILPGGPTLGRWQGQKYIATPDTIQIQGSGSTGDASGLSTKLPIAGTIARSLSDRVADSGVNVRDFGAVCDGATNNAAAFQAAFAAASIVRYDLKSCASHYLINTPVTVPAGRTLIGPSDGRSAALGILTTANIDTFTVTGDQFGFERLRMEHRGSNGRAINASTYSYGTLREFNINATSASNVSPIVQINGSLITVSYGAFNNQRTGANSIIIDGLGAVSPVVDYIQNVTFGGPGFGIQVSNSGGAKRPEGIYLTNNHCFTTNTCLLVSAVNDLRSVGNTYDIGAGNQVALAATGEGIDMASFTDDYFSTLNERTNGVCLSLQGSAGISRVKVSSKFAYCGYGISSTNSLTNGLVISGSTFLNMNVALNLQNVNGATITGNTCQGCANNFILADGANGGPYTVSGNLWDATGAISINSTNPEKFFYSSTNAGRKLSGYSTSVAASFGATGCLSTSFAHGLASTPNLSRITLTPALVSGSPTNITAAITGVDATNITAQVCLVTSGAASVRLVANASL